MSKELLLVYMDCPFCGARKAWGDRQLKIAEDNNITIRKVSFVSKEATDGKLMWKAVKAGILNYPFFTDGEKFSKNVDDFVKKPAAQAPNSPEKQAKKHHAHKTKEVKDGVSSKN